jgi:ADP-heptose:LPS heptosyltransferase
MNLEVQRAVDRYVGVPLCALLSLANRFRREVARDGPPRRILVILLSEMGSLVLAQPMFARLSSRYPEASIHVLLFAGNRQVLDVLGVVPPEHVITLDDRTLGGFLRDVVAVLRRLRALDLDVVIDCELFARVSSILALLSGASTRVGFHRHTQEGLYRGAFINRPVPYNPYQHLSQQFLTLASSIDARSAPLAKAPPEELPPPPPFCDFPPEEIAEATNRLHADFPSLHGRRIVLVYPGGGALPIRAWPLAHYRELCGRLLDEGFAVAVIGLKSDQPLAQAIVGHSRRPHCVDLTGYTSSVRHLLLLFHRASLLVTNDGGPGQFAALTPIPSIVLFGPETPALYRSLGARAHVFYTSFGCSPCLTAYNHRRSPCDGDNQCLKHISPAEVLAKAHELVGFRQRT